MTYRIFPAPGFPAGPLAATMAKQTIATMAAFSVPALAPAIARDLDADGAMKKLAQNAA